MPYRDVLVHVDSTKASLNRVRLGLDMARRFGARLSGLHVIPDPDVPRYVKPSGVEHAAEVLRERARAAAPLAEAHFRKATMDTQVAVSYETVEGDIPQLLAERARFSDMAVLGQCDAETPTTTSAFLLPQDVVMLAGVPVLVAPPFGTFDAIAGHVLLTWDGSREAIRALHDALPLLQIAERVSLVAIDPDRQGHVHPDANATKISAHLARHGISTEPTVLAAGGESVAKVLLAHAAELGAGLLIMGAYGHSRVIEFLLGGTTQNLLAQSTIPVLILH